MKKLTIALSILAVAGWVVASEGDDLTSLSYISYLERYATVQPASQQESIEAVINMPLVPGDRVDTARECRMEIVLSDGNTLWLDEYTTVSLDAVAFSRDTRGERTVLYLAEGAAMVEVSEHGLSRQPIRVDGSAATVYLNDVGLYRIETLPTGGLRLEVIQGLGEASTSAGGVLVRAESAAEVGDGKVMNLQSQLTWGDEFARWVEQRRQVIRGEGEMYVDARYERQAAQLDNYGSWVYVDTLNSWAWQPTVGADWRPYTAGRWYWTPTGWSWLSYEPWGWLPYHYGSWYLSVGFGWVWSWHPYWSPAWVRWAWWPGYVGWSPWGYYDYWYWPRYCHYYGWDRWPYYPDHPGGGHGGSARPPRRDVVPPPASARTRPSTGSLPEPGAPSAARSRGDTPSLDLNGRMRVSAMDRAGWNVVSDGDFASPHLARLVEPGDRALRDRGDEMGVVMSRPLETAPPSRARPSQELARVFREAGEASPRDLSPLLARSDSLEPTDALRLVEPTSPAEVTRRAAAPREVGPSPLTTAPPSPMHPTGRGAPSAVSRALPGAAAPSGIAHRDPVAYSNPFVSRSRPSAPVILDSGRALGPGDSSTYVRRPSSVRSPVSVAPPSGSRPTTGSRPVVVPRTAPSTPSGQVGSRGGASRPPMISAPSGGSAPSARPSSPPTSRSSAGPPSGGAPSSPPAAAPRSSGGGGASSSRSGATRKQ